MYTRHVGQITLQMNQNSGVEYNERAVKDGDVWE